MPTGTTAGAVFGSTVTRVTTRSGTTGNLGTPSTFLQPRHVQPPGQGRGAGVDLVTFVGQRREQHPVGQEIQTQLDNAKQSIGLLRRHL